MIVSDVSTSNTGNLTTFLCFLLQLQSIPTEIVHGTRHSASDILSSIGVYTCQNSDSDNIQRKLNLECTEVASILHVSVWKTMSFARFPNRLWYHIIHQKVKKNLQGTLIALPLVLYFARWTAKSMHIYSLNAVAKTPFFVANVQSRWVWNSVV